MKEPVPPIMNDKIKYITVRLKESVVIPCVAYANPKPIYRYVHFLLFLFSTFICREGESDIKERI